MASLNELTDAHILLLAAQLTSDGDLARLRELLDCRRGVLSQNIAYRLVLSFYPVDTPDQSSLIEFLKSFQTGDRQPTDAGGFKVDSSISTISRHDALGRCRTLRIQTIPNHLPLEKDSEQASFIIEWAKRLEALSGTLEPLTEFVEHFVEHDPDLRHWYETYVVPVLRLQYEFYPDAEDIIGVQELEKMTVEDGVSTLLQYAERRHDPTDIARDLDYVVTPWVCGAQRAKRRRIDSLPAETKVDEPAWESVNNWLINESLNNFEVAAKTFAGWKGPSGVDTPADAVVSRYAQTGLAIIYACPAASRESLAMSREVLMKVATLIGLAAPDTTTIGPNVVLAKPFVKELEEIDLLSSSFSRKTNQFTRPTASSVQLLVGSLATSAALLELGLASSLGDVVRTSVFGSERRHKDELRRLLQQIPRLTRKEIDWRSVRRQLRWFRTWSQHSEAETDNPRPAYLGRLTAEYLETQTLDSFLTAGQYDAVKEVYLDTKPQPLPVSEVESRIVASIFEAYDNASNGNRDRGGMKRAYEILRAFRSRFPRSTALSDIDHLIRATHSLSFYQLTLQHGVPFRPVAIRVQKDPLTLLEKVLGQDLKAYTKLDDLLEIGRNLVRVHLPSRETLARELDPVELRVSDAEHRITYHAIMAALAVNDFDTAYAYITTRLSSSPTETSSPNLTDDVSWRAAYAAGKHRPSVSPKNLTSQIDSLAQRMELLSRALMLAPSGEALSGILATWRRYEEELEGLKAQAVDEERSFDAKADAALPGGFGVEDRDADVVETKRAMARRTWPTSRAGPSYEEEAPMGLFDVARGAATALRKSAAFPLGSGALRDLKIREAGTGSEGGLVDNTDSASSLEGGRTRKRDMVANMVTNNLVSGIGWVLGAPPRDRLDQRHEPEPDFTMPPRHFQTLQRRSDDFGRTFSIIFAVIAVLVILAAIIWAIILPKLRKNKTNRYSDGLTPRIYSRNSPHFPSHPALLRGTRQKPTDSLRHYDPRTETPFRDDPTPLSTFNHGSAASSQAHIALTVGSTNSSDGLFTPLRTRLPLRRGLQARHDPNLRLKRSNVVYSTHNRIPFVPETGLNGLEEYILPVPEPLLLRPRPAGRPPPLTRQLERFPMPIPRLSRKDGLMHPGKVFSELDQSDSPSVARAALNTPCPKSASSSRLNGKELSFLEVTHGHPPSQDQQAAAAVARELNSRLTETTSIPHDTDGRTLTMEKGLETAAGTNPEDLLSLKRAGTVTRPKTPVSEIRQWFDRTASDGKIVKSSFKRGWTPSSNPFTTPGPSSTPRTSPVPSVASTKTPPMLSPSFEITDMDTVIDAPNAGLRSRRRSTSSAALPSPTKIAPLKTVESANTASRLSKKLCPTNVFGRRTKATLPLNLVSLSRAQHRKRHSLSSMSTVFRPRLRGTKSKRSYCASSVYSRDTRGMSSLGSPGLDGVSNHTGYHIGTAYTTELPSRRQKRSSRRKAKAGSMDILRSKIDEWDLHTGDLDALTFTSPPPLLKRTYSDCGPRRSRAFDTRCPFMSSGDLQEKPCGLSPDAKPKIRVEHWDDDVWGDGLASFRDSILESAEQRGFSHRPALGQLQVVPPPPGSAPGGGDWI
ncbi:hypothetical protein LTR47_002300 [Exophiala xenobiotica]|nr:hypothetical protein LTR47_002300 [Exophiala xenobiotica]KAK5350461.1 hypothetical protein LTR61_005658 [Exophiala xenobiotica]KAK5359818.1 hypothetical protein LTS03_010913 [Exophiala xenobiotica]